MTNKMNFDLDTANEYDRGVRRTLPTYDALFRLLQAYFRKNIAKVEAIFLL